MEAENATTLPKEVTTEIFFREEACRIREAFDNDSDEENLDYLRHQLGCMKSLMTHLELPWDRLIPILFRSFANYIRLKNEPVNNRKTFLLTAQLMDCITYMSQNGRMVNTLAVFFNNQIDELDRLLAKKTETLS